MTSAVRVGGERLYRKAHRGETVETPEREVEVHRAELLDGGRGARQLRDRVLAGHLRPDPDRDARGRLLREPAADARSAPFDVDDAASRARPGRGAGLPARARARRPRRPTPSRHGRAVERRRPPATRRGPVRLTHDGRLLAVATARGQDELAARGGARVSIEVTTLPDAEPRARHVAIGTFDGVHVGHQAVIDERRHGPHLRPPPARDHPPGGAAEADHAVRGQARRDRRPRRPASWS